MMHVLGALLLCALESLLTVAFQVKQKIFIEPLQFNSDWDARIGANCTFGVKQGLCGPLIHLHADVDVVEDPLARLCFVWQCPDIGDFGMLITDCWAETKSGSRFTLIKNSCGHEPVLFVPKPCTPAYGFGLTGARAQMPLPLVTTSPVYITCSLAFCQRCECLPLQFTPPHSCYDYDGGHSNQQLLSLDAFVDSLESQCLTTEHASSNTTEPTAPNRTDAVAASHSRSSQHMFSSTAYLLITLLALSLLICASCR